MITENDRICFLGDSITFGAGTTKRYFEYIAEKTGAEVHGFGIDGASTAHLFTELQRMEREVGDNFDVLCVLIGTNDFNGGVPVGEFFTEKAERVVSSTDENGEPNGYLTKKKRDFIFTDETFCGRLNKFFAFVVERRAADIWSVELIDAYRESGLFPLSDAHAKSYFHDDKTDRLHPAAKGHFRLAETILRRI